MQISPDESFVAGGQGAILVAPTSVVSLGPALDSNGAPEDVALRSDTKKDRINLLPWNLQKTGEPGLEGKVSGGQTNDFSGDAVSVSQEKLLGIFRELLGGLAFSVCTREAESDQIFIDDLERRLAVRGLEFDEPACKCDDFPEEKVSIF